MKKIKLTQDKYAIVDDEDFEYLSLFKWYFKKSKRDRVGYAFCINDELYSVGMHRILLQTKEGEVGDHINGDTLDNRKTNLRVVTVSLSNRNKKYKNSSGFLGICVRGTKWVAHIRDNSNPKYLGTFSTPEEAHICYGLAYHQLESEGIIREI